MEAVVPFCPLCQTSFTHADRAAYVLSCNHLVCSYCLNKQLYNNEYYRCYFDGTYTSVNYVRELTGLAWALSNEYLEVMQITMGMQAKRMDEVLKARFNLYYERATIPCRTSNCALAVGGKCGYDHTNRFYKKTNCAFGNTCPNMNTCIFLHPGETRQTFALETSSTPRPSHERAAFPPVSPPSSSDYDPNSYYSTMTYQAPCHNHYASDLPTVETLWTCPNCHSSNRAELSSCPQCSYYRS